MPSSPAVPPAGPVLRIRQRCGRFPAPPGAAATGRAAVQQALVPAVRISKETAAALALGSCPLVMTRVRVQRVVRLVQLSGLLARSVKPAALVQELVNGTSR
jgi:hypothetical protein